MKSTLALLFVLLGLNTLAFTVRVEVIEGYKSKPFAFCEVIVKKTNGSILSKEKTNVNGILYIHNIKSRKVIIEAVDKNKKYYSNTISPSGFDGEQLQLILYPTDKYEAEIWEKEDEKFGTIEKWKRNPDADSTSMEKGKKKNEYIEFPGGHEACQAFIVNHVIYPQTCIEMDITGKVYVYFIVEPTGEVSHVFVHAEEDVMLEREAKRLIRSMPKWEFVDDLKDQPERIRCNIPINFTLN